MDKMVINQLPIENLRGKRVFVRLDADMESSSSGELFDESKLRLSLPTLEYLMGVGARIIIGTHLGNPEESVVESLRLDPAARRLTALLGKPVCKLGEAIGREVLRAVADMRDGDFVLLKNLRFYAGEDANEAAFTHELARLCDVYCTDAFALAHRGMASTVSITRVDIGPSTVKRMQELFAVAQTIFWNGPLGIWEIAPFGVATREVARLIAERVSPRSQRSIL